MRPTGFAVAHPIAERQAVGEEFAPSRWWCESVSGSSSGGSGSSLAAVESACAAQSSADARVAASRSQIRLSYACSTSDLKEGLKRLEKFMNKYLIK